MSTPTRPETVVEAPPGLPLIRISREFSAPPGRVYQAHVDPDLAMRWLGPRDISSRIDYWEARTGGRWRYVSGRGAEEYWFYGSFHELRPGERIVQTFTFEGMPDAVALEIATFVELPGGRTRLEVVSVGRSVEDRDAMVASGMEHGVVEGYQKLDDLLSDG